jgi:hypothetical protein
MFSSVHSASAYKPPIMGGLSDHQSRLGDVALAMYDFGGPLVQHRCLGRLVNKILRFGSLAYILHHFFCGSTTKGLTPGYPDLLS